MIVAAIAALAGCDAGVGGASSGTGASFRVALTSTPDAVAAWPLEERMALAMRMDEAVDHQRAAAPIDTPAPTLDHVEAFDAERAVRGDDAILALIVDATELRTRPLHDPDAGSPSRSREGAGGRAAEGRVHTPSIDHPLQEPPRILHTADPALEAAPYATALHGRARPVLLDLAAATGATELVLAPPIPAAAVADAERIHINPVWLALLAELDAHDEVAAAQAAIIGTPPPVGHHETESDGWGCYSGGSSWDPCSGTCSCGYCGLDCGSCACECGDGSDDLHCTTAGARRARGGSGPLELAWLLAPAAYLFWRRRRG